MNWKIINLFIFFFLAFLYANCSFAATTEEAYSPLAAPESIKYSELQFKLPPAERVELENGIVLFVLEDQELPLINISALIKTGTIYDPAGKEGVAELTATLMRTGGTTKLNSKEIDERFDSIAASPAVSMSIESASIDFTFLSKDLDQSLELLSQIIMNPAFEQNKFLLARDLKNEDLRRLQDDPQKLAFREFNRLLYYNNPRGRFPSHKSLNNIKREDLIEFHNKFFSPDKVMFAVTGNITKEEAVNKFRQYFGYWKNNDVVLTAPRLPEKTNGGLYYINKKIPQSTIVCGEFSVSNNNPDFYAFTILDFIIGSGGFPSRIFSSVRNNEGLAYSAGSFYRSKPAYGVFGAYAFTSTGNTFKTLNLINNVLKNVKSKSVTDEEIQWAKKSINNSFIFSFLHPMQIAGKQMKLEYDQLPADYLFNYRNKIDNVNSQDIKRVAANYLDEKKRVVLILGDIKSFDKSLNATFKPVIVNPLD